jgi:peptidoglycan DL-endopeptidase CwlO
VRIGRYCIDVDVDMHVADCYNTNRRICNNFVTIRRIDISMSLLHRLNHINRMKKGMGALLLSVFMTFSFVTETDASVLDTLVSAGAIADIIDTTSQNSQVSGNSTVSNSDVAKQEAPVITVEAIAEETYGFMNLGIAHVDNHLNVRKEPKENGEIVGKMPKNSGCEILSIENGWAKIKSGQVEGYVSTEFLYTGQDAKSIAEEVKTTMATVNTMTLKVRTAPSLNGNVLTLIPEGEELEVLEDTGEWVKIAIDDEEGFISKEYVDIAEELDKAVTMTELRYGEGVSDVRIAMVAYAKKFVGNPYVWGGTSLTNGADCSGFVMSIYKNFGISLPHSSRAQAGYGTKISLSEAKPGDLVFYGNGSTINHVAIYIGGGQVVHASSARTGIKISNASYRTPLAVRRILS